MCFKWRINSLSSIYIVQKIIRRIWFMLDFLLLLLEDRGYWVEVGIGAAEGSEGSN